MCLGCHDGSVGDSRRTVWVEHGHLRGITPPDGMTVPKDLPLVDGTIVLKVPSDKDYRSEISRCLMGAGAVLLGMREKEMSLEEAFVTITQENVSLFTSEEATRE